MWKSTSVPHHRVDGVEVDAAIQDERAVNLISTQVNVYDEEDGGALHCREGAITKSQYTVVAPFLAAALGEASTDAPTPGGGSDGTDGRSHSVLLWTAVFLLLF